MQLNKTMNASTSTINMTLNESITTKKNLFSQGQEMIHERINKMDRGTLLWGTIGLAAITCLILLYIGIKTFVLRKKRQTRRYKLLSNATTMEEPLFNEHDDEGEDRDDDTLFVRK